MMKVLLLILLVPFYLQSQDTAISAFLIKWENSQNYLLEVAEAMPESSYDFKPTVRQMTFEQQLIHIQNNMNWLVSTYFKELSLPKNPTSSSKDDIANFLKESFEAVAGVIKIIPEETLKEKVDFFAGKKSKLQILHLLQDHVTHHRGQLIVYLNLNNIKPPRYIGW
jgi:uncharacterized damage-inducible protein DinB